MVISGTIGSSWYDDSGTSSKEFRKQLDLVPAGRKVRVCINSEGGSVADALEIYNLLQARKDDVTCCVDGYALSSASIIALGGGRTIAPHSSILMAHEPWSMTVGNEDDHLKAATMLSKHGDTIASIYAKKTGKPASEMRDMMRKESWFTGPEAVEFGLADAESEEEAETEAEEAAEEVSNRFAALDIAAFRNIPSHIFNMLRPKPISAAHEPSSAPAAAAGGPSTTPAMGKQNTDKQMNKKAILALLKTRGVELAEDSTEEQVLAALTKLGETPTNSADPAAAEAAQEVVSLRNQLQSERKIRITAEVKRRAENKISNDKLAWWTDLAMKDEAGTLAQIDGLPVNRPGGEPVALQFGSVVENHLEAVKALKGPRNAEKRFKLLRDDWDQIIADALNRDSYGGGAQMQPVIRADGTQGGQRLYPVNANSYSASLVTQFLLDGAVTKLQNLLAPLNAFTRGFSTDRYKPRATAQLKFVTGTDAAEKNPTDFEAIDGSSGNSTVGNVQIAVDQYNKRFHVTNDELNSGLRMENLVDINIAVFANTLFEVATAPLALATQNVLTAITRAPASFAWSDMATARGELKKSPIKNAILDGEYFSRLVNQPSFYQRTGTESGVGEGWKGFGWDGIWEATDWTGTHAGAGDQYIRGLFCNPQGLGVVAGLPLMPPMIPGNTLTESTITVPGVDISVASYSWFSLKTRSLWCSFDAMFGSASLDTSAIVLLLSQ